MAAIPIGAKVALVRIPLAVKVMVAFVAVIAAGALPVHWSLRTSIRETLHARAAMDLRAHAALLAERAGGLDVLALRSFVKDAAALSTERFTLMTLDGTVVFDSRVTAHMENHLQRLEMQAALHDGVGVAERLSATDGVEYVYVAVPVTGPAGMTAVLRLARESAASAQLVQRSSEIMETGMAVAVSLALLLSFAAAASIVRPLRRMRDAAASLAAGDLDVAVHVGTHDELEELAVGLQAVGAQLRSRLAATGSGETLLGQLVHAMEQGVVVISGDGRVHHINGAARAQLGLRGPHESERVAKLLQCNAVVLAAREAIGDPLGVDIRVPHPVSEEPINGTVVALRRPDGEPLIALILDAQTHAMVPLTEVPDCAAVATVPLREMMDRALAAVAEDQEEPGTFFAAPDEWPATLMADVGGRVEAVVSDALKAAARAPGAHLNAPLTASLSNGSVVLRLPVNLPVDVLKNLEPRLAPLGGKLESAPGNVLLWLPRA